MEGRDYLKYFLGCVSIIIFCLSSPSFAWESETESSKNLRFSVRIFTIPQTFSLEQMSFSYNGLAGTGKSLHKDIGEFSPEIPIPVSPLVDLSEKQFRPQGLNDRIRKIGAFLFRYIDVGEVHGGGGGEAELSRSNRIKDQKITFEFESTPTDFSGGVLFTVNI